MNDQFLQNYRKPPRQAFIQALRNRLELNKEKAEKMMIPRFRPVALGALTLVLALALALAISPSVRAYVQDWIGQVGGVAFTATNNYPGGNEPVTTIPSETMSLEEARATLPFLIDLPTWVPDNFVLQEGIRITRYDDNLEWVDIRWDFPEKSALFLTVQQRAAGEDRQWIVGQESTEEVLVKGQPAALVRGGWDYDAKQWNHKEHLTLYWKHNEQTYILQAIERDISVEDLIRIAESIP